MRHETDVRRVVAHPAVPFPAPSLRLSNHQFLALPHGRHKKAVVAVAHAVLVTAYHLLARKTLYQEPGSDYYDRRHAERARHHAVQALERQGYCVILEPAA